MRPAALGLLLLVCTVAAPAAERAGAFFPSLARVHIPRGTAQLLKPYLPKPQGRTGDYRFVVELPRFASFVAFEPGLGAAPDAVTHGPGRTRVGVAYTRHVFRYRLYPTTGFELSICWQDSDAKTLRYQPAIQAGGTFDWTRLTAPVAAPEGAAFARPLLIKWQKRGITGTIWADNVAFRPEGSERNLVAAGTFDEPAWKTGPFAQEGKGGGRCAKFVCTPERVDRQQALWVHPERKGIAVTAGASYVVELDLKVDRLGPAVEQPILAALFRASDDAPEGRVPIFTYCLGPHGKPAGERETELVVLPPLKNVRPKAVRIAPCHYRAMFTHPKVAQAYAENAWRSGITWSYGSVRNHVVPLLRPLGHRVWLAKPGHPFVARGAAGRVLEQRPELRAVGFDGKPTRGHFCPTWLLSPEGAEARRLMEEALLELVAREGYTAVNWDIEQPVVVEPEGGGPTLGFCLCPRCLEAFRKRQGLAKDEKLDPQAIVGKHRQAWAMFRCGQNAELVGHVRRALKRSGRPIEFSVYSGYQCQRTRERYGTGRCWPPTSTSRSPATTAPARPSSPRARRSAACPSSAARTTTSAPARGPPPPAGSDARSTDGPGPSRGATACSASSSTAAATACSSGTCPRWTAARSTARARRPRSSRPTRPSSAGAAAATSVSPSRASSPTTGPPSSTRAAACCCCSTSRARR